MVQQPLVDQDLLIIDASLTHTPQPIGLLWTNDQPEARTSPEIHYLQNTDIHAPGEIRTRNPSQ
jgi:hypothetical protein